MSRGGLIFPLGFFCGVISIVLYGFLGYHLWLISRNTTTNETYKWTDYVRYVYYYISKQEIDKFEKESEESNHNNNNNKGTATKRKGNNKEKSKEEEELPAPKYKLDSKGKVVVKNRECHRMESFYRI